MKSFRCIIFCILVLSASKAFGQKSYAINKGSMIISGGAGFWSQGGDLHGNDRLTIFNISPSIEYFVISHMACGGKLSYSYRSQSGNSSNYWGVGPKLSYYFGNPNSKLYPFISGSYNYLNSVDYSKTDLILTGGVASMISENVAITGSVYFMIEEMENKDTDISTSGNTFGIEVGLTIFIF